MVLVALIASLPSLPSDAVRVRGAAAATLRLPAVRVGLLLTLLLVTGHFAAFTYVRPVLEDVSNVSPSLIGALLMAYGVAGVAGNFVAGMLAGRDVAQTLRAIAATMAASTVLLPLAPAGVAGAATFLVLWGFVYGGVAVSLQTWMMKSAGAERVETATGLMVAVFNASIALGALLGGVATGLLSTAGTMWLGGATLAIGALVLVLSRARAGAAGARPRPQSVPASEGAS